ncbi:helix-turn-helix domain-containing protein [Halobacteriovorax sp.]|uniref:helix-turn-helix domain-containing protein n=1 Tax=Halobacteriovorax sp. TaxID=2020862 RepID=UPI003565D6A0
MDTEQNTEELSNSECIASNEVVSKVTIGEYLRLAREERDLSLKVISQHTKISVTILENIENNCFDKLPSKAYVIGFVKSYSKTIGLDEAECLKLLNEAYGSTSETIAKSAPTPLEGVPPTNPPVESSSSSKEIPTQYLTIAGVFVALIILFAIVINNTSTQPGEEIATEENTNSIEVAQTPLVDVRPQEVSEKTPLTEESEPPVELVEESTPEETETSTVEVKPVEKKKEEVKTEAKPATEEEKKVVTEEEKKEDKEINLRAIPLPLYEVTNDEEAYTHLPENIKASLIQGKQNIFISAVDGDTWITYKSDDGDIKKFVLSKGRTLLIRGDVVRVFLGNINVAQIFLNNKALKITSRSGVKSLVFPQEKAVDYKLPLFLYPKPGQVITSSEYEESITN